jgi:hypothetical protein
MIACYTERHKYSSFIRLVIEFENRLLVWRLDFRRELKDIY